MISLVIIRPAFFDTEWDDHRGNVYGVARGARFAIGGIYFDSDLPHNAGEAESINATLTEIAKAADAQDTLQQLVDGRRTVLPANAEHARNLRRVADAFLQESPP